MRTAVLKHQARAKVAEVGEFFVKNGSVVLTHGVSRARL